MNLAGCLETPHHHPLRRGTAAQTIYAGATGVKTIVVISKKSMQSDTEKYRPLDKTVKARRRNKDVP